MNDSNKVTDNKDFYSNGLNFSCQQCGYCCRFEGGVVRLSEKDLAALAKWSELTEEQFIQVYCRYLEDDKGNKFLCLKNMSNGDCIFWNKSLCNGKGGCDAYLARPVQCSTFPFWTQVLNSEESWQNQGKTCPGINCGSFHTKEEISAELKKYQDRIPLTLT